MRTIEREEEANLARYVVLVDGCQFLIRYRISQGKSILDPMITFMVSLYCFMNLLTFK